MPVKWLSREKCLTLMEKAIDGRLATGDKAGQPYITPINFVLHDQKIYFHCGFKGRKLDNIQANPKVCFEISFNHSLAFVLKIAILWAQIVNSLNSRRIWARRIRFYCR